MLQIGSLQVIKEYAYLEQFEGDLIGFGGFVVLESVAFSEFLLNFQQEGESSNSVFVLCFEAYISNFASVFFTSLISN